MYFNDNNKSTNIDDEFDDDNILSHILKLVNKYKIFIIISLLLLIGIIVYFTTNNSVKNVNNYLTLIGEENITIYQDSDYIELGFEAYNSKNENLTNDVIIKSTLDTSKIGEYEISYTIGDITKIRRINVVAKPQDYTYIYLKTIDNSVNIYLNVGETYTEPGYQVFSSNGKDLTSQVKVDGTVDTSKKGSYKLIYSVVDSNNVTISVSRIVIVMDTEISLTLSTAGYTNKDVTINVKVIDDYFDYLILPDNTKITDINYSYKVSSNGTYKFKVHNKKGIDKEASIEVKNIDREAPSGSCSGSYKNGKSTINIKANDNIGIQKYTIDGISYTNNSITINKELETATIIIYDKAGNTKNISCKLTSIAPSITNITKDGVIITINAKKTDANISGYYFSYTNQKPDKNGGYLKTSNTSIDVVRLVGTTYVWVEDENGRISDPAKITISDDALLTTTGSGYKILKGTKLSDYLRDNGWSIDELNKLIARSVRAAGLYTKIGAATAAVSLQTVLAQKYNIKLPYESAGIYRKFGADPKWGNQGYNYTTQTTGYYGMDCSAFVTWTYVNTGYDVSKLNPPYWAGWKKIEFSKENGEIGDFLVTGKEQGNRHVKLIIGKTSTDFIIAESSGSGMVIQRHSYSSPNGYSVQKGENFDTLFGFVAESEYPSGF